MEIIKLKKLNQGTKWRYWTKCPECSICWEWTTDQRDPINCPVCNCIACPHKEEDERN